MDERKRRGIRAQRRKNEKKHMSFKIVQYIIGYIIVGILGYMAYGFYIEAKVRTVEEGKREQFLAEQNVQTNDYSKVKQNNERKQEKAKQDFISVPTKYEGYKVDCRLEVPKIKLNTNVLTNYTKSGLKICASKYYGPSANEVGNYCIAGHNYNKKNMFNHLINLKIGDNIYLTDNNNGKVEYIIYDMYRVRPENVEPLSQETGEEKEITLITCVNYSTKRLVVKAIARKQ